MISFSGYFLPNFRCEYPVSSPWRATGAKSWAQTALSTAQTRMCAGHRLPTTAPLECCPRPGLRPVHGCHEEKRHFSCLCWPLNQVPNRWSAPRAASYAEGQRCILQPDPACRLQSGDVLRHTCNPGCDIRYVQVSFCIAGIKGSIYLITIGNIRRLSQELQLETPPPGAAPHGIGQAWCSLALLHMLLPHLPSHRLDDLGGGVLEISEESLCPTPKDVKEPTVRLVILSQSEACRGDRPQQVTGGQGR
jgi:hypothetical protein